jgi:hypothetical protein
MLAEYRDAVGATEAITNINQQRGNKNLQMLCKQYPFLGSSARRICPVFDMSCWAVVNPEDSNPVRSRFALEYVAA